jgi:hypothetical protein
MVVGMHITINQQTQRLINWRNGEVRKLVVHEKREGNWGGGRVTYCKSFRGNYWSEDTNGLAPTWQTRTPAFLLSKILSFKFFLFFFSLCICLLLYFKFLFYSISETPFMMPTLTSYKTAESRTAYWGCLRRVRSETCWKRCGMRMVVLQKRSSQDRSKRHEVNRLNGRQQRGSKHIKCKVSSCSSEVEIFRTDRTFR